MKDYLSIQEIQTRLRNVFVRLLNNENSSDNVELSPHIRLSLQKFMTGTINPQMRNNPHLEDELLNTLLNILVIAGELGIDLEEKTSEYLNQLEGLGTTAS